MFSDQIFLTSLVLSHPFSTVVFLVQLYKRIYGNFPWQILRFPLWDQNAALSEVCCPNISDGVRPTASRKNVTTQDTENIDEVKTVSGRKATCPSKRSRLRGAITRT